MVIVTMPFRYLLFLIGLTFWFILSFEKQIIV